SWRRSRRSPSAISASAGRRKLRTRSGTAVSSPASGRSFGHSFRSGLLLVPVCPPAEATFEEVEQGPRLWRHELAVRKHRADPAVLGDVAGEDRRDTAGLELLMSEVGRQHRNAEAIDDRLQEQFAIVRGEAAIDANMRCPAVDRDGPEVVLGRRAADEAIVAAQLLGAARLAMGGKVLGRGAEDPTIGGELDDDEARAEILADANREVDSLLQQIESLARQDELHRHLRMLLQEARQI